MGLIASSQEINFKFFSYSLLKQINLITFPNSRFSRATVKNYVEKQTLFL